MTRLATRALVAILALAMPLVVLERRAWADCAGSPPADTSDKPCTVDDQCPSSGVTCNGMRTDFQECKEGAEARGLTLRCEIEDASIYCPEGEQARNVSSDVRPLACACTAFGVAALMALSRAQRRRKGGPPGR